MPFLLDAMNNASNSMNQAERDVNKAQRTYQVAPGVPEPPENIRSCFKIGRIGG